MKYIKDYLEEGGHFEGPLLVKTCEKGVANNGNEYLTIVFQDVTGSLYGKKWTVESDDLNILVPGKVVLVNGDIFKYKGHPQIKVEKIKHLEESQYDINDFYVSCPIKEEALYKELDEMIELIEDEDIKKLVRYVISKNEDKYMTYPAAVSVHHAYRCGIVYHSLSIARMACKVCELYKNLNRDYLVAGAILHDLGKTREMAGIIAPNYTFEGNMLGHISMGFTMVMEAGRAIGTPENKLTIIGHMILAHHGQFEFGSPVKPQTPEALVLHMLDDLDAKMNILENYLKDVPLGEFSQKIPFLDSKAFLKTK